MKQYKKISVVFIVVCAAIAMFQIYWLTNSYKNQKELIERKINIAFKESIQEIEIFVVKKDIAFTASLLNNFIPQYKLRYDTDTLDISEVKSKKEYINIKTIDSIFRKKIQQALPALPIECMVSEETISDSKNHIIPTNYFLTDKIATIQSRSIVYFVQVQNLDMLVLKKVKNQIVIALLELLTIILGSIYTYKMIVAQKELIAFKNDFVTTITHELKTPIA